MHCHICPETLMPAPGVATHWVGHLSCTFLKGAWLTVQIKAGIQSDSWRPVRPWCRNAHRQDYLSVVCGLGKDSSLQFSQGYYVPTLSLTIGPDLPSYLRMTMLANIHLSKGAGVPNADNLHCEVAEEVYDLQGPRA